MYVPLQFFVTFDDYPVKFSTQSLHWNLESPVLRSEFSLVDISSFQTKCQASSFNAKSLPKVPSFVPKLPMSCLNLEFPAKTVYLSESRVFSNICKSSAKIWRSWSKLHKWIAILHSRRNSEFVALIPQFQLSYHLFRKYFGFAVKMLTSLGFFEISK